MTVKDIISKVDRLKPNTIDGEDKFGWINDFEKSVYEKVHSRAADTDFEYTPKVYDTDLEAELLIESPHTDIYLHYLFAQIDLINQEFTSYNNNMTLYNSTLEDFSAYYRRNHAPKASGMIGGY